MARILGVDIPNDKQVQYSLTYIYGVGLKTAQNACAAAGVEPTIRVKNLTEEQITAIRNELAKVKTEGELRREVALNIKRLQERVNSLKEKLNNEICICIDFALDGGSIKYVGVEKAEAGLQIADMIYERHEIISEVLVRLGVSEEIAAEDACRIEHVISAESFAAIKKHIGK